MLVALNTLASAQTKGTEATARAAAQLLDYAGATHPDTILQYTASDMILHVHSDASYLSEPNARSRAGGLFFLSTIPSDDVAAASPPLNGAIHITSSIMRNVLASATEAEVGALFYNCQEGCMLRTTLDEMGHPKTGNARPNG
jgi:hypothetical protein